MDKFQTKTHQFRRLSIYEVKDLEIGNEVVVCTFADIPRKMVFDDAIITSLPYSEHTTSLSSSQWNIKTSIGNVTCDMLYEVTPL